MTRIRNLIAMATVVAAGGGAAAALATTGAASAGTPSSGTFVVRAHHGSESNIDLGRHGFSPGDVDLFAGSLTSGGQAVGRFVGTCSPVTVSQKVADQLCEFVLHLGSAQIIASGTVRSGQAGPGTFSLPVLGGTGRYSGAGGQIAVTATNGKSFPITVSLH